MQHRTIVALVCGAILLGYVCRPSDNGPAECVETVQRFTQANTVVMCLAGTAPTFRDENTVVCACPTPEVP